WFPSNDHPSDKARFSIRITVPRGLQAISNGRLAGVRRGAKTSTWHGVMPQPMATYLAFAAMGRYRVDRGRTPSGRPYIYAVAKGLKQRARRQAWSTLRKTGIVTRFLAKRFGRYPYGPIGGVVPKGGLGFALETQARP